MRLLPWAVVVVALAVMGYCLKVLINNSQRPVQSIIILPELQEAKRLKEIAKGRKLSIQYMVFADELQKPRAIRVVPFHDLTANEKFDKFRVWAIVLKGSVSEINWKQIGIKIMKIYFITPFLNAQEVEGLLKGLSNT